MIKQIVKYEESKDAIVTIAIGEPYLSEWKNTPKNLGFCIVRKIKLICL